MKSIKYIPFEEVLIDVTGGNDKILQSDYKPNGRIPIIDQGESLVGGYTDDISLKYSHELPCIVFGDHTKLLKYIDFDFALGADGTKILLIQKGFDLKFIFYYLHTCQYPSNIGYSRHFKFLKIIRIPKFYIDYQIECRMILDKVTDLRNNQNKANKLTEQFLHSAFIEMFGDPITNPKGFVNIPLGEVIITLMDYHSNGSYESLRNNVKLLDTPDYAYMIRTTDLEKQDYQKNVKYVSKSSYEFLKKSKLYGGEIIINKIGSAGQIYLMPYLNKKVTLGMNQFGLRFNDKVNSIYIYYLLKTNYGKAIINKKVFGAVTKTITKEAVRSLNIPLPPITLQKQFVDLVQKIEVLKGKQKESEQELNNLFNSLMQKAFKGDLL
jgi:type I restriction enzyme S subunit